MTEYIHVLLMEWEYTYTMRDTVIVIQQAVMTPYIRYLYRAGMVHGLNGIRRGSVLVFPGCLKVRGFFWSEFCNF